MPRGGPPAPLVEIIADGGGPIGYGPLGRCLAVADVLGTDAAFSVAEGEATAFVVARGARVDGGGAAGVVVLDRRAPVTVAEAEAHRSAGRRVVLLDDPG